MTLKRKPIKYIWREDSTSHCLSNKDYQIILNGCIDGSAIFSVKIDGCRIRLGKDENGNKLFYTSRHTEPCYESDVGYFLKYQSAKNCHDASSMCRAMGYDHLMRFLVNSGIYNVIKLSETFSFECVSRFVFESMNGDDVTIVNVPYTIPNHFECILVPHSRFPSFESDSLKVIDPTLSLDVANHVTSNMPREALKTALQSSFERCEWDGIVPAPGFKHEGIVVTVSDVVGKIALS
jgi:hypothetical protein